jgi:hypothetical protein
MVGGGIRVVEVVSRKDEEEERVGLRRRKEEACPLSLLSSISDLYDPQRILTAHKPA